LKSHQIGQIKNDSKNPQGSGVEATIPGLTLPPKPSQVHPPAALIEAMMTEIVENITQNIPGEISCLETMLPDSENSNECNDPLYTF
jgi:hypothetical protein